MEKLTSINYIRGLKEKITDDDMKKYLKEGCKGVHESIFKSYNILNMVKIMLKNGDSTETINWVIEELEKDNL